VRCKRVTIFEGPDGSGKTTAATKYAEETDAKLVHCGPFQGLTSKGLPRMYLEAMLPALLGYQDVVMDRCWLSEPIYGRVFRGADRLGAATRRLIERVAMRCDARVVRCLPSLDVCLTNWRKRHASGGEYLEKEEQLIRVWERYTDLETSLPMTSYNFFEGNQKFRRAPGDLTHLVSHPTAGNLDARVLIVGSETYDHTDYDGLARYPFCELGPGTSRWLAGQLEDENFNESDLLWTNMLDLNEDLAVGPWLDGQRPVVALGVKAEAWLQRQGVTPSHVVSHPQAWRQVHTKKRYPLLDVLKEILT